MRSPFVPSPVALAILSAFRRLRRRRDGTDRFGVTRARPIAATAVLVAFVVIGSRLSGTDADARSGPAPDPDPGPVTARDSRMASNPSDSALGPRSGPPVTVDDPGRADAPDGDPDRADETGRADDIVVAPPSSLADVVPVERHERLAREKRELELRVAALEAETTALESEMLSLDLQVLVLESAAPETGTIPDAVGGAGELEPDASDASEPIELGNATLVPAPLPELDIVAAGGDGGDGGGDRGFLVDESIGGRDEPLELSEPFLPSGMPNTETVADASTGALPESSYSGTLPPSAGASADEPVERLVVLEVPIGSDAADVGVLPGDVLLAVDDRPVTGFDDLAQYANGDPAPLHELELMRDDRRQWVVLTSSPAELSLVLRPFDPARLIAD